MAAGKLMNTTEDRPWSVVLRLDQVGQGTARRLTADAAARERIAQALDLAALDSLEAELSVKPAGRSDYLIEGRFAADAQQVCGVTLEPFPVRIESEFSLRASEQEPEAPVSSHDMELGLDSIDPPDPIEDGQLDLGAYVVEHLALELDPFPRKPGAEFEPPAAEGEPSPFAVLAKLRQDKAED